MAFGRKSKSDSFNRALMKADEGSVYGLIIRPLGQGNFEVYCSDKNTRIAHLRGKLYKRVKVEENDVVLLSLRPGDGKNCDIELKYWPAEVEELLNGGEIKDSFFTRDGGFENSSGFSSKVSFSAL